MRVLSIPVKMNTSDQWCRHIRIKLLVLIVAAGLPFAGFIGYMAAHVKERRIADAHQRIMHLAHIGVGSFDDIIRQSRHLLDIMSRGTDPGCDAASATLARSNKWIDGLFVIDAAGTVRCSVNPGLVGIDLSGRPEIVAAFASDGFKVSDAFIAKARGVPLITATTPLVQSDGTRHLLALTIDLTWFDLLSERIGEHNTVEVVLVDGQSVILSAYPKRPELVGTVFERASFADAFKARREGTFDGLDTRGADAFIGLAHVPDSDLHLIVLADRSATLANLRRGLVQAVVLFVLVAAAMSAFVWIAGTRVFASPMAKLATLLSGTLENMDQGLMVVDSSGRIPICNKRAMEMLDLPSDLMGASPKAKDILAYQQARGDFTGMDPQGLHLLRPTHSVRTIYERETHEGLVLEVATVPFASGGVVRTYTDVTQRKTQERKLSESEARYRLIAEFSSDIIAHSDLDFNWTYVSPAVERVLGYHPAELIGNVHNTLTHPDDLAARDEARRVLLETGQPVPVSKRLRHAHGHYVWLEAELCLTVQQGVPMGILAIYRDVSARRAAEEALARSYEAMSSLATVDALTGIANRRELDRRLEQECAQARATGRPLSLLIIDVDHYKLFNDSYGHVAGDECLKRLADLLAQHEQRPADLAARFGGEEFVLLLPETDGASAARVAELICSGIDGLQLRHEKSPFGCITVSIGIATAADKTVTAKALLGAADRALYAAKQGGRNRCETAVVSRDDAALQTHDLRALAS
jgi:diguanylate cyclase (GGDEF)-like protein/PAS domain S-box-containing protein